MILGFNVCAGDTCGSGDDYKSTLFPLLSVFNSSKLLPPLHFSSVASKKETQKV